MRTSAETPTATHLALRTRSFRLLTAIWVAANTADSLLTLFLAVWVKDLTGSNAYAGLVLASVGIPALFAPALGLVVDRTSRRRFLASTYGIGALALLLLLFVRDANDAWLVLVVAIAYGAASCATSAAQSGLLRDLVPDSALGAANGRLSTIDSAFRLAMPVLGAAGYAVVGAIPLVLAAAAGFTAAGLLALRIRVRESPPAPRAERFAGAVTAGFRHLRSTPPLGRLTLALGIGFGATGMINGVAFAVVDEGLNLPPEALGPLTSAQGVAAVIGGLTAARALTRWGAQRTVALALVLVGLGVIPMLWSSVVLVALGMGAVGAGVTWAVVAFATERQVRTAPQLQGRTQAAGAVVLQVPQLFLALTAAAVVDIVDFRALVAACAVGVIGSATVAWPARRADARPPARG